ncbi:GNAT family N-acetyltransferase [Vibrio kyushuensis]|uniref:GNAT family N-acetyltransferase n=1 Tax=Vibrio kyushuensis TaxID=2910249 RepID=UPI003D131D5D
MDLELRDITRENFYQICLLQVAPEQVNHVDSNSISLAEANFMAFPWYRGIYVNDAPVGFILVDANTKTGKFALWRLMLDESHQSKGFGRKAIQVLGSELTKEFSITKLFTSVVSGKGGP